MKKASDCGAYSRRRAGDKYCFGHGPSWVRVFSFTEAGSPAPGIGCENYCFRTISPRNSCLLSLLSLGGSALLRSISHAACPGAPGWPILVYIERCCRGDSASPRAKAKDGNANHDSLLAMRPAGGD